MFLNAGSSKNIRVCDIIGIFDTDNATLSSPITKKMLSLAEKCGEIEMAGSDIPKSFIVYTHRTGGKKDGTRICFSELSSSILLQRMQTLPER